jgi:hypothetical protein
MKDIFFSTILFKWGQYTKYKNVKKYYEHLNFHTDFRKFDDTLRLILDCSIEQVKEIEALLKEEFLAGNIFYGIHKSDSSLMTCLVQTLNDGDHIHFIDGNNGGYTSASKIMKQQKQKAV